MKNIKKKMKYQEKEYDRGNNIMTNEEKGIQGEQLVLTAILNAIDTIKKSSSSHTAGEIKVFNNVIIEFLSAYGINSIMTTEIDHIIVASDKVVLVETKNGTYESLNYRDPTWRLMNQTETSNPIVQNRTHKEIFCDVFDIEREDVCTVECLMNYENPKLKTHNSNDYVFGSDNLEDNFIFLLEQCFEQKDYEDLIEKLNKKEKMSKSKKKHHSNDLNYFNDKAKWTAIREGGYLFAITDIIKCKCGSLMCFKWKEGGWVDHQRNNKNRSRQYLIGCTAYRKEEKEKHDCYIYNKKKGKGFKTANAISLHERKGWKSMEENRMTKLDRFYEQERLIKNYISEKDATERELKNQRCRNDELNSYLNDEQIRTRQLESELNQFSKLFGKIYIKKR